MQQEKDELNNIRYGRKREVWEEKQKREKKIRQKKFKIVKIVKSRAI